MAKGSTLVIIVALAGNLAIALAKFVASRKERLFIRSSLSCGVTAWLGCNG